MKVFTIGDANFKKEFLKKAMEEMGVQIVTTEEEKYIKSDTFHEDLIKDNTIKTFDKPKSKYHK